MDFGYALGQGLAAGARSGVESIEAGQKQEAAIAAEQRAADRQLDTAQRMMAIQEAMKNRAAERFSTVVKAKMTGAPLQIAPGDPAPLTNEDMTVKPSIDDAAQQALDETLMSDPAAYQAGTGMLGGVMKEKAEAKRLESREKIEADKLASREHIEETKAAQRERAEERRFTALMARVEKSSGGGKNGSKSAMVQNLEWMRDNLKWTPDQLADYVTEKKHTSTEDIAAKLLSADKFGELTPEVAMQRAQQLVQAGDKLRGASAKPAASGPASAPKRMKYNPATGKIE